MTHLSHGIVSGADGRLFRSVWNTANTSTGSSTSTQVKLPLISTGTYNFVVDWGDGSRDTITVWNAAATTHTYSSGGTYTIKILGQCEGWSFNNTGDRLKLLNVQRWGTRFIPKGGSQFQGCSNMVITAPDVLNTTGVVTMASMWRDCTVMTTPPNMSTSDVSAVSNFSLMWRASGIVTPPNTTNWNVAASTTFANFMTDCTALATAPVLTNWNTPIVTTFAGFLQNCALITTIDADALEIGAMTTAANMFSGVTLNTTKYNQILVAWEAQTELTGVSFHGGGSKHSGAGTTARGVLTGTSTWTVTDGGAA
jgi:hypothetical protein